MVVSLRLGPAETLVESLIPGGTARLRMLLAQLSRKPTGNSGWREEEGRGCRRDESGSRERLPAGSSRETTHDPGGCSGRPARRERRLQGGCEPRRADRSRLLGVVQPARGRALPFPVGAVRFGEDAQRSQPHPHRRECGRAGRGEPGRRRAPLSRAARFPGPAQSDSLELWPAGQPGWRAGRLPAPAPGAAGRDQSAVRADLSSRRAGQDARER